VIGKNILLVISLFINLFVVINVSAQLKEKGIYISQSTAENTKYIEYLIRESKVVGINTFIIDFTRATPAYVKNIQLVHDNNIKYVVRIVIFPDGGCAEQILSKEYWQKKYRLIERAIALGAKEVQLDYIRYKSSQPASEQNAQNIYQVIKWFKDQLEKQGIPLQIDVFGISVFGSAVHIGQNLQLFSDVIDGLCPMVYPSHFEPYEKHSKIPYETIYSAMKALRMQFNGYIPFKVYPYIELSNYHYRFSTEQKLHYIYEQLRAAKDSDIDGWYAWSPSNSYNNLFLTLKMFPLEG
jgi:hypothetical protein